MTKQSFTLDPAAQSYTDDEIVVKINASAVAISRVDAIDGAALGDCNLDDLADGSTNKGYTGTEQTKLSGIAESATVDQTGVEVRDLILALADADRGLIATDPAGGEFKVISIERDSTGKLNIQYDDVAE